MTSEQFSYWLQGFSELVGKEPTKEQWKIIQDHLQLVFKKITPSYTPHPLPNYHDQLLRDKFEQKIDFGKPIC